MCAATFGRWLLGTGDGEYIYVCVVTFGWRLFGNGWRFPLRLAVVVVDVVVAVCGTVQALLPTRRQRWRRNHLRLCAKIQRCLVIDSTGEILDF